MERPPISDRARVPHVAVLEQRKHAAGRQQPGRTRPPYLGLDPMKRGGGEQGGEGRVRERQVLESSAVEPHRRPLPHPPPCEPDHVRAGVDGLHSESPRQQRRREQTGPAADLDHAVAGAQGTRLDRRRRSTRRGSHAARGRTPRRRRRTPARTGAAGLSRRRRARSWRPACVRRQPRPQTGVDAPTLLEVDRAHHSLSYVSAALGHALRGTVLDVDDQVRAHRPMPTNAPTPVIAGSRSPRACRPCAARLVRRDPRHGEVIRRRLRNAGVVQYVGVRDQVANIVEVAARRVARAGSPARTQSHHTSGISRLWAEAYVR